MYNVTLAALAAACVSTAALAQNDFGPLIEPAALEDRLTADAPLILDIRGDAYGTAHIPGAVSAPYAQFRGPADNPGQLVPEDVLQKRLRTLGLTLDRPVAIVHEGDSDSDFGAAARVYWTLKSSGVSQLAILDGGMTGWEAKQLPLDVDAVTPTPSNVDINFSDQWLATTQDVADTVEGRRKAVLVDARPASFYEGKKAHGAAERPGTLPGAINLVHSAFFTDDAQIVGADRARQIAASLNAPEGGEIVSFCNTGHWAATDWFAMSELAGLENVKLYPESMVGYSKTDGEIANTPGLFQNLVNQITGN